MFQDIVLRLDILRRLENDRDRVDCVRFNADGNLLVYGGLSDRWIKIWDWEAGIAKLTFESGHVYINHFFVAKFMPNTGDRRLITCAADDQDLVLRLDVSKKLEKNYVKTVSFNADGNILVSSSVDKQIMLWDWETGIPKLTFESGHGNLCTGFRAKIMPYTDDRSLITCGGDGQVRHARISECGVETRLLAKHQRNASDLAFEP
ncbi:hypothetical protein V6N13_055841 [Hibiscus sabdariffa]